MDLQDCLQLRHHFQTYLPVSHRTVVVDMYKVGDTEGYVIRVTDAGVTEMGHPVEHGFDGMELANAYFKTIIDNYMTEAFQENNQ